MSSDSVKLGIVGLGRWAKVLARAAQKSKKFKIVAGYSRSEEKRKAFTDEFGIESKPDMQSLVNDPEIKGVMLTVPNEHHLPCAEEVAKAGKHVYTEKTHRQYARKRPPHGRPSEEIWRSTDGGT